MGLSSSSKTYNTQVGVQPLKSMLICIPAEGIKSKSNWKTPLPDTKHSEILKIIMFILMGILLCSYMLI